MPTITLNAAPSPSMARKSLREPLGRVGVSAGCGAGAADSVRHRRERVGIAVGITIAPLGWRILVCGGWGGADQIRSVIAGTHCRPTMPW
jgi:hypothetical protein